MSYNNERVKVPSLIKRIYSVWFRHIKVYSSNFISNAFPPFFEPLIFLAGLSIGIGTYIQKMGNMDYKLFLASGLIVTSSMFTAAFECSFGTFIRLEFDKVYDGMLGSPISSKDLIIGEILFAGTKGFLFSFAVLIIIWLFGIISYPISFLATFVGFLTGLVFAVLSLLVTSFVKNINHFNFYHTGILSPMFFFSGVVFPITNLPKPLQMVAEIIPLTHLVRLSRAFCVQNGFSQILLFDLLYCILFILIIGFISIKNLEKRLIG